MTNTDDEVMVKVGNMCVCNECQNIKGRGGFCTTIPKSSEDLPKCHLGFVAKWELWGL